MQLREGAFARREFAPANPNGEPVAAATALGLSAHQQGRLGHYVSSTMGSLAPAAQNQLQAQQLDAMRQQQVADASAEHQQVRGMQESAAELATRHSLRAAGPGGMPIIAAMARRARGLA